MSSDYTLYGMQPSYYTAKVRGYLAYKRIPYTETYSFEAAVNVIAARTKKFMLPTVITPDDKTLQDSTDIIDYLEGKHPERPTYPTDPTLMMLCRLFEVFADECMVYPGLHYRWGFADTHEWALREFAVNGGRNMPLADAVKITRGFADKINNYLPVLGLDKPEIQQATVDHYKALLQALEQHLAKVPYLLGDAPCLADFAMHGPFWGHLYRDHGPANIDLKENAPNVCIWTENLHSGFGIKESQNWRIEPTLLPVLKELAATYSTLVADTYQHLAEFLVDGNSGDKAPVMGNEIQTSIKGIPLKRRASVYNGWKISRWLESYYQIPDDQRDEAEQLLADLNLINTTKVDKSWNLEKKDYELYFV